MNEARPVDPKLMAQLGVKNGVKKSFWRRRWWQILIGIIVLAGAGYMFTGTGSEQVRYKSEAVERKTLIVKVSATGTLEPEDQVDVGSEVSGQIAEVLVDYNDRVTKGQVLARLDTDQLEARVIQAKANVAAADAGVKQAEATEREARLRRDRIANLLERGNTSQQELDTANATLARAVASIDSAKAQVELVKAQLAQTESDLAKAEIRSPIDGIVLDRKIEPGQTVASSFQTPVLFTLASDLTRMEILVSIDEADIGDVRAQQIATFQVDAFPNRKFEALIESVRNAPRTVQNVVTYEAVMLVKNEAGLLKPGMTATAEITTRKIENALTVPNGALRFTPRDKKVEDLEQPNDGTRLGRLWLETGGEPKDIVVTVGSSDGARTEVIKGELADDAKVLTDILRANAEEESGKAP
ncbi:MAG: efflux RND transporter periplasmic adaptor subunit [Alphaproteobacteria bacterium]|nr:efflux RND transporter periplasmic adaptor subunit [Alphaproteobacteria bacterium]